MSEVQTAQSAEAAAVVTANFDNTVDKVAVKFSFRKVVNKDEKTGIETENKRPTVELELPLLSVEGIIKEFEAGGKRLDLIVEAVRQVQLDRAREIVNENESISQDNFPFAQLSWEAIANLPKAERRGGGIPKEVWEDFIKDYILVMPAATNKSLEQVTNASKILMAKFQTVKTNKPILELLKGQIAIYANTAARAEEFSECISFLTEKADSLLNLDEAAMLAAL